MSANQPTIEADGVLEQRDGKDVIRFERHLAHPVERVWAALTEPDELINWWGEARIDLVEGGPFQLRWLNTDEDGNSAELHGTITRLRPPNLLEISGDLHGVLRWELRREPGGTRLSFTSTLDLPEEYRTRTIAGWHFHLDALADALEGRKVDLVRLEGRWGRSTSGTSPSSLDRGARRQEPRSPTWPVDGYGVARRSDASVT